MAPFKESPPKQPSVPSFVTLVRICNGASFTYLGLPGSSARDVRKLGSLLENVICIDQSERVLADVKRNIANLQLKERRFPNIGMWEYLRDKYPTESLIADVSFLDFCGGGLQKDDPFATEVAGVRCVLCKSKPNTRTKPSSWLGHSCHVIGVSRRTERRLKNRQ